MVRLGLTFKKITDRGTKIVISKLTFINWASEEFRQFQTKRLSSISSNFMLHVGRGIRTMRISDLPKPQKLANPKGHIIVINRGTKTKKI